MTKSEWIAAAPFGIEGIVARELRQMGFEGRAQNGGVLFTGSPADAFYANMHLRSADRVSLVLGEFPARSFEELFEGIYALPWADYLPERANFPVTGKCVRAQLMSLPDCQKITKKAIVKKLQKRYRREKFPEDGANYRIQIALMGDTCTVSMNASGDALNKRGYRKRHTEAPLRESLAAALLLTSPFRAQGEYLIDPMCGSGTFAIEAAMMRYDRAPGLKRAFDCEQWHFMPAQEMADIRESAVDAFYSASREKRAPIWASDIDPEAAEVTAQAAREAGVEEFIDIRRLDAKELVSPPDTRGLIVCNPPYGERLGDAQQANAIAALLGDIYRNNPNYALCALSSRTDFERNFGRRADKRRRLYNGRIECEFLTFSRK